jgi:16S rRNA (uracil1498-N3)-methyltransferase
MPYFYAPDLPEQGNILLTKEESAHLAKTLRAKVGDRVQLINGNGQLAEAEISNLAKRNQVGCKIISTMRVPEPTRKIHLYMAPPRSNIMSSLIKQCVELGVWEITLLECEFSVSKPKDKDKAYFKEIISGAKQSGNPFFPKVNSPVAFNKAFENCPFPKFYGAVPEENSYSSEKILPENTSLWIGPEGGFSPTEQAFLQKHAKGITIGNWVLRVETACIGLVSILNQLS